MLPLGHCYRLSTALSLAWSRRWCRPTALFLRQRDATASISLLGDACPAQAPKLPLCCQGAIPFLGEQRTPFPHHNMLLQPPEESLQSNRVRTPL